MREPAPESFVHQRREALVARMATERGELRSWLSSDAPEVVDIAKPTDGRTVVTQVVSTITEFMGICRCESKEVARCH